jgi:predicted nuclease with TOPRIM domain
MKNTLKKLKHKATEPFKLWLHKQILDCIPHLIGADIDIGNLRDKDEELEEKIDNCVSLDWFSEEIEETHAFQELKSEVDYLRQDIKELTKELAKLKGEGNE